MTEGIVDLNALDPEHCTDDQGNQDKTGQHRGPDRDETDPFQSKGDADRPRLDFPDIGLVAVLIEHALSSSHIGSILAWFRGANEAETGASDRR